MRKINKSLMISLLLTAAIAVISWFVGTASYKIYHYYSLTEKTTPENILWSVKKIGKAKYLLQAEYTFRVGDNTFIGITTFNSSLALNALGAESKIDEYKARHNIVWYEAGNIKRSTVEKKFPARESLYAGIVIAITVYFTLLTRYIKISSN